MKLAKGERTTLLLVGGLIAFLYVQHRRAMSAAAPAPAPNVQLPGLAIPAQMSA